MIALAEIVREGFGGAEFLLLFLGTGLIITGFVSLRKGRTWINQNAGWSIRTIRRSEDPLSFWGIVVSLYWGLGLLFVVCSAIFAAQNVGYLSRPLFK